jgi:DME family drug/metabolite transporter
MPRSRAAWTRITTVALLAAAFQACYFASVARLSVSLATLITIGAAPLLVLATEAATGRRRLDRAAIGTAGLAVAGLTLLIGVPSSARDLTAGPSGVGFALLSAGGFAALTVIGSRPVPGLDEMTSTGLGFTLGAALLIPVASAGNGVGFTPTPVALGLLLLLGAGPTAIAYAAYFRGLRTAQAGTAALMALLEPLVGTALSVLVLGDRLAPAGLAGATLLLTALVLQARHSRPGHG